MLDNFSKIDEVVKDEDDDRGSVISSSEPESDEVDCDDELPLARAPGKPARYRAARSNARVADVRQSIEQVFCLPEGSVALCEKDGRALRGDAFIKTLRNRWQ